MDSDHNQDVIIHGSAAFTKIDVEDWLATRFSNFEGRKT
jgi:hypothetical protein